MDKNKLKTAFNDVKPTEEQKERMLKGILDKASTPQVKKEKKSYTKQYISGLAAACVVLAAMGIFRMKQTEVDPSTPPVNDGPIHEEPISDPPVQDAGMRDFLNFNGYRYEFLNTKDSSFIESSLLEKVGQIEHLIDFMNPHSSSVSPDTDLASTFGVGGEIYKLKDTDSYFRIAVKLDDDYYLCQNVGTVDTSSLNPEEYIEKSDLKNKVQEASLLENITRKKVKNLSKDKSLSIIDAISESEIIALNNDDYETLSQLKNKERLTISFKLKDGTRFEVGYIEKMNLLSLGDSYYKIQKLSID